MKTILTVTALALTLFTDNSSAQEIGLAPGIYVAVEGNSTYILTVPKKKEFADVSFSTYRITPEGLKGRNTIFERLDKIAGKKFSILRARFMVETRQVGDNPPVITIVQTQDNSITERQIYRAFTPIYDLVADGPAL